MTTTIEHLFTTKNIRNIWKQLKLTEVPIVTSATTVEIESFREKMIGDLRQMRYVPDIGHGYLAYPKARGCARFVPILTKEDITLYYLLVLSLEDYLVFDLPGIYGGWRTTPKGAVKEKSKADPVIYDGYFNNTLSKKQWFKNWSSFTDLLDELTHSSELGNYVIATDIANFYDTIDIGRLCSNIASDAPGHEEKVALLKFFLSFWNRRVRAYHPVSSGIPQEIISDASRILANYFLKPFDEKFISYCNARGLQYVRWADDIIVFGNSPRRLESAIYQASKTLMSMGLNLNASKTRIFSRSEYRLHRGLDVLKQINRKHLADVVAATKAFQSYGGLKREDTVFRALLGYAERSQKARIPYLMAYLDELATEYDHLAVLGPSQFRSRFVLSANKAACVAQDVRRLSGKPYASAKASYLLFIRKYVGLLKRHGIGSRRLAGIAKKFVDEADDKSLLEEFAAPATLAAVK
ncbi:MAG: RNA-directed DNA polymerase [Bauldia sp.]|nr:RNA-directed DNA polymerase [Bauldia sp.]